MLLPAVLKAGASCPPGKFWQRHMLVSSGRCHSAPGNVAGCEAAAVEMGLSSTAAPVRAMPAYPPGCIVVHGKADHTGSLNLFYNTVPVEQSGNNCNSVTPPTKRFITALAMLGGRDQMAAGVEGVVDGGMD